MNSKLPGNSEHVTEQPKRAKTADPTSINALDRSPNQPSSEVVVP